MNRSMTPALQHVSSVFLACAALAVGSAVRADTTLELTNKFINDYKERATIDVTYTPKFAHDKPKKPMPSKPSNDGDIHISGTAPQIGLLSVAEIMNAKDFLNVASFVQQHLGSETAMKGVWRIWPEHGGESHQVQFDADPNEIVDTNPDHVFEVHPLIRVAAFDISSTFHSIPGFRTKDAQAAFLNYENASSEITPRDTTTTIRMSQATYNYVEFKLELLEDPTHNLDDGLTLFARVRSLDDEVLVQKRRMVFVGGTKPEQAVRTLSKGQCMHALGMPRLNLALVSWRTRCSKDLIAETPNCPSKFPDVLRWKIPYEIVVLADYKGSRNCAGD